MPACVRRRRDGTFRRVHRCDRCVMLSINGRPCHEIGCPDAWKDEVRECRWCGGDFKPESSGQRCCEDSCAESFYG